ncbi:MAG TPA: hypothetical protein VLK82_00025 [Candidatus Tectomicrobia bacterium]|nr:hypothetical protein [Candidatus Tectomicrobia bacterium]
MEPKTFQEFSEWLRASAEHARMDAEINRLNRLLELERDLDCTDFAHPAYWRGTNVATKRVVEILSKAVNGEDDGAGAYGYEPLERLRRRIIQIRRE